ncbi:2-amino-1-hydroxyethylphosphonate dioxygenase (glycine-forming)-like [Tachypleus tridentatus]|uniref:2-amino-1-hydroxyethylphosphonate dioxygenase (glycine-forming)-like n=1 Tax=Tachypleus tridentatus TaxID=6853 RepID=UPI003FD04CB4
MTEVEVVNKVFTLFEKYGNRDYLGEPVTQTQHMLQCARLAENGGFPTEVVLGALFHDIGHLVGMDEDLDTMVTNETCLGAQSHEVVGERFLKELGFPSTITDLVRGHVDAKRYLVFSNMEYYKKLSDASKLTLVHQGGAMTPEEAQVFSNSPSFDSILLIRSWDDQAKDPKIQVKPLDHYKKVCLEYMENLQKNINT